MTTANSSAPSDPPRAFRAPSDEAPDSSGLPPLHDPYFVPPRAQKTSSQGTFLAAASIAAACLLGPLGAIAALPLGYGARKFAPRSEGGVRLAGAIGMVLGALLTIGWTIGGVLLARDLLNRPPVAIEDVPPEAPTTLAAPPAVAVPSPSATVSADGTVPKATAKKKVGAITVVDVGVSAKSLSDELAAQRKDAQEAGEQMVVMTTRSSCNPCRGVDASLTDPLLQDALAKVRLVRVDIDVFQDELGSLKIPNRVVPGFFLLGPDLTPRDGVNGGEWDDDIPRNIAPVLGPFVRGKYTHRREQFKAAPSNGIQL